ncbi:MAG: MoCo/4Fe-4S cofactor protein with predicted Tat translocation signal [Patiriisocius sp.]|jgi:MoCo/4Fe-4S cofactor protein with predicted Tat translocation signal
MGSKNKYWAGLEELHETESFKESASKEFADDLTVQEFVEETDIESLSSGRRDFLKFLGFSVGAATLAACETPVTRVIPYVVKPDNVTPGMPTYYASTYSSGGDYASILVKTREGRPIFISGNPDHGVGKPNARIIGSVLSLYNSERLLSPMAAGSASTWSAVDSEIGSKLAAVAASGKEICILSSTVNSPTAKKAISKFAGEYNGAQFNHVVLEANSLEAIPKANEISFGQAMVPHYDFAKSRVIVSVGADFLNDWLLTTEYAGAYAASRNVENDWMSNHFQYESIMSVAGSNADHRFQIKPSQEGLVLASIYNQIAGGTLSGVDTSSVDAMTADAVAALKASKGKSLVICGANDVHLQLLTNKINEALNSYGSTINKNVQVNIQGGNSEEVNSLLSRMKSGQVGALLISDCNPSYVLGSAFDEAIENVGTSVSFSQYMDETATKCNFSCPTDHFLESWNDYNIKTGHYSVAQPTINRLYDTRQFEESLLKWSGSSETYYKFLKDNWSNNLFASQSKYSSSTDFWNNVVHNSAVQLSMSNATEMSEDDPTMADAAPIAQSVSMSQIASSITAKSGGAFELILYTKTGIGNGDHANNPWMQELPDPITKVCWDNYITMSISDADGFKFNRYLGQEDPASMAKLTVGGSILELPVVVVPGQAKGTVGVALGYGRGANGSNIGGASYVTGERGGYVLDDAENRIPIGANAYTMVDRSSGTANYRSLNVNIEGLGKDHPIALTQTQHTVLNRHSIVKETSFGTFKKGDRNLYNKPHTLPIHEGGKTVHKPIKEVDLWGAHPVEKIGHRWGMTIDLNTCTGCSACVTACHAENNVPVVGKDEVRRGRDMHWLRIDRYFSSVGSKEDSYEEQEFAEENPQVVHMPMMCQHCNHAPCETVCPVAATTHSNEGLNQMVYNRCIGTRYCANNCPYKVRRFNWFNYKGYRKFTEVNPAQNDMGRLVLNPDVTVRSRGVMEKCSMCVQRIQAGKLSAKIDGTPVKDGSIVTACAEACPTKAINFGDLNDNKSFVKVNSLDDRSYQAIEEVGTQPNIYYQTVVRNVKETNHA